MNKKKILLLTTVSSMIAVVGTVIFANGSLSGLSALATNGEVWHHYAAVAPSETTHGSKEFWASSTDGCATHTFTDPGVTCVEHDFSTYDSFTTLTCDDDRYVPSGNESLGITPMFSTKNKTVTYGLYPQKNVNDSSLVSALNELAAPESNGWYLYNNNYYAKVRTATFEYDYEFDNGTTIEDETTYWFKCEPISWTILTNDYVDGDGNHVGYYLLSDVLLDAWCYHCDTEVSLGDGNKMIYPNHYEYSEINEWLNIDFYKSAFALHNSYIQEITVDNSASTTDSNDNPYVCDNGENKVFLPSYQDYINSSYGFSTNESRCCKTTDWARARGAWCSTDSSYLYNGYYWTRSPRSDDSCRAWVVDTDGGLSNGYVSDTDGSVRPALSIKIA